jgi:molecular chaperone GrpE (heat shock protein)
MTESITILENCFIQNLQTINKFKNEVELKELDKHDQLIDICRGIIESLDTFDKVEEWLIEKELHNNEHAIKTKTRYKSIEKRLLNLLQRYGITKIEFPENRYIAGLCEVVETEVDSNRKNDEIITVVRSGYIRGKELIRSAQIIIVKN